jgi:hypothetical protein
MAATTLIVGCGKKSPSSSATPPSAQADAASSSPAAQPALTAEQATAVAVRLANEKALALYQHQPFVAGQPAQSVAGHWLWVARQGYGHGDIQATVELAADGSTNRVDLQLFDSQNRERIQVQEPPR